MTENTFEIQSIGYQDVDTDVSSYLNSLIQIPIPRRGRPRSKPWYCYDMIGNLAITNSISSDVADELQDAAHHAENIGRPLNLFVTIKPDGMDDMSPAERAKFWIETREWEAQWLRNRRPNSDNSPTFVWAREAKSDATGEHMHMLIHIPDRLQKDFKKALKKRFSSTGEVDVRKADLKNRFKNGYLWNHLTYLMKGQSIKSARKRGMICQEAGPIAGKRAGCSENLNLTAIRRWSRTHLSSHVRWTVSNRSLV